MGFLYIEREPVVVLFVNETPCSMFKIETSLREADLAHTHNKISKDLPTENGIVHTILVHVWMVFVEVSPVSLRVIETPAPHLQSVPAI